MPNPIFLCILLLLCVNTSEQRSSSSSIFSYQCPHGCYCVPDVVDLELLSITCGWETLQANLLSQSFPKNATKGLTIQCPREHNQDESGFDTSNMFQGFDQIRELRITNCQLRQLTDATFAGLPKLRALHLSHFSSSPTDLPPKLFRQLHSLEKLTLADSAIENIPQGVLCSLRFLQILNISSNKISNARLGVETSHCILDHLIILDLANNRIRHISSADFNPFPSLRQLGLSHNGLRSMELEAFRAINLIQRLDLDHNQLRELAPLPESLYHLNLAHNNLAAIPPAVANLGQLITLDMSGNKIDSSSPFSLLSGSIEVLDLSRNMLREVPTRLFRESTQSLLQLNLSHNEIEDVQPFLLQNFSSLKELDLSTNRLKSLSFGIFHGLQELTILQLNNNSLYHVDVEVFSDLSRKLTTLEMSNNLLTELPMAIGRLSRIKTIDFSNNQISKAYKFVLNKIAHLTKLDLSNNNLNTIESYVFSDTSHLKELDLSHNKIMAISNDAFEKSTRLEKIDLSGNQLTNFSSCLSEVRSLKHANVSDNLLEKLEWSEMPDGLVELNAGNNKIASISEARPTMNLKVVDLHHNQLSHLLTGHLPTSLEHLDISHNQLSHFPNYTFFSQTQLKSLDLRSNHLQTIPASLFDHSVAVSSSFPGRIWVSGNPVNCDCHMGWLLKNASSSAKVTVVDFSQAECLLPLQQLKRSLNETTQEDFLCPYSQTCEPNCICCQYGSCDCKSKCPEGCQCFHDHLLRTNVVRCHAPKLKHKPFAVRQLPMHASHIYLSGLELPVLKSHDFLGRSRLTRLHITGSNLRTIQPNSFNALSELKELDLSNNRLQRINGDETYRTPLMQKLNLQMNDLKQIDGRLAEIMPNLKTLLLDHNNLEDLPEYLFSKPAEKLVSISLGSNPFRCDCSHTQKFKTQAWLLDDKHKSVVVDLSKVYCVENVTKSFLLNDSTILSAFLPNLGEDIFTMPMLDFLQQENRSICVMKTEGIFGGSSAQNAFLMIVAVVFIILVFIAILHLFISAVKNYGRSAIKNRYQQANSLNFSSTDTANCSSPSTGPLVMFDVFVSYSKKDEDTVIQQFCRPLESQDFTLCLLHQDGPLRSLYNGSLHSVSDELIHQLKASQTLLIYITRDFLANEWPCLSIKTSHQLFAKLKHKKLIAIVEDDVSQNELESELGQILRKNTLIPRGHHLFWNLLMSAIPRRGSPNGSETSQLYSEPQYGSVHQVPSQFV